MNQNLFCDCFPRGWDGALFLLRDARCPKCKDNFWVFLIPYKSAIDEAFSVKLTGLVFSYVCLWNYAKAHKHAKEEQGQNPAILTKQAWPTTHTSIVRICFFGKPKIGFRSLEMDIPFLTNQIFQDLLAHCVKIGILHIFFFGWKKCEFRPTQINKSTPVDSDVELNSVWTKAN